MPVPKLTVANAAAIVRISNLYRNDVWVAKQTPKSLKIHIASSMAAMKRINDAGIESDVVMPRLVLLKRLWTIVKGAKAAEKAPQLTLSL